MQKPRSRLTFSAKRPTIPLTRFCFVSEFQVTINYSERALFKFFISVPLRAIGHRLWRGPQAGLMRMFQLRPHVKFPNELTFHNVLLDNRCNLPSPTRISSIVQEADKKKTSRLACMLILALK